MAKNLILENLIDSENDIFTPLQFNLVRKLESEGPLTRRELVKCLNTPRTTIYDNLVKLQQRKIVEKFSRNNGQRGRPKIFWKIKED